jgi:hypothetical protein
MIEDTAESTVRVVLLAVLTIVAGLVVLSSALV